MGGATYGVFDNSPIETALTLGISPFTTFVVVTRAREAGRRDADRRDLVCGPPPRAELPLF